MKDFLKEEKDIEKFFKSRVKEQFSDYIIKFNGTHTRLVGEPGERQSIILTKTGTGYWHNIYGLQSEYVLIINLKSKRYSLLLREKKEDISDNDIGRIQTQMAESPLTTRIRTKISINPGLY